MVNKSELKLADGSRWDGNALIESDGTVAECTREGILFWLGDEQRCYAENALAAIRAVDGDPEYLELVELRKKLAAVDMERVPETELDGCIITRDIDGTTCAIGRDSVVQSTDYGHLLLVDIADGENCLNAPASAVLTVIRAAGLDPEYLELKRLRAENEALRARYDESQRERDDFVDQIVSGKCG